MVSRVRKVSRLYAERYGTRDHHDRQREKQRRIWTQQERLMRQNEAKTQVAQKNSGKAFHEAVAGRPPTPKPKLRERVSRMFRRQGR